MTSCTRPSVTDWTHVDPRVRSGCLTKRRLADRQVVVRVVVVVVGVVDGSSTACTWNFVTRTTDNPGVSRRGVVIVVAGVVGAVVVVGVVGAVVVVGVVDGSSTACTWGVGDPTTENPGVSRRSAAGRGLTPKRRPCVGVVVDGVIVVVVVGVVVVVVVVVASTTSTWSVGDLTINRGPSIAVVVVGVVVVGVVGVGVVRVGVVGVGVVGVGSTASAWSVAVTIAVHVGPGVNGRQADGHSA